MHDVIIPSIIASSQEEMDGIFQKIGANARTVQLDVMDGKFVPTHSLDFNFYLPEREYSYEAQLLIDEPEAWIQNMGSQVHTIIPHLETLKQPLKTIRKIKSMEKKAALAIRPETPVSQLKPFIEEIDQVLVMTVQPGYYGAQFLPETLDKVREIRALMPEIDIEVDGGIQPETIGKAKEAGANLFVSGSYLLFSDELPERLELLRRRIN